MGNDLQSLPKGPQKMTMGRDIGVPIAKDESFHFFRRNFGFRWPAIRKRGAKCRREKFRQISVKIGEKITETWLQAKNRWNFGLYRWFFGKFPDISYQSSPRTGYKICPIFIFFLKNIRCSLVIWSWLAGKVVFQPGSKIVDLGFVNFKSNGTKAKRP